MTDADNDRVVAALESALAWMLDSGSTAGLPEQMEAALPIARAMAALVAADVEVAEAEEAFEKAPLWFGLSRCREARNQRRAALVVYRRALGEGS